MNFKIGNKQGQFYMLDWLYEYWLPLKRFEYYEGSNWGRIRSVTHYVENQHKNGLRIVNGSVRKQKLTKGYLTVNLTNGTKNSHKPFKVHRLISETFLPNPNNYNCVNHKDENKANNCVWNLEWCDVNYNNSYGTHNERCAKKQEERLKKVYKYSKNGELLKEYKNSIEAALCENKQRKTIVCSCNSNAKKHTKEYYSYDKVQEPIR